MDMYRLEVRAKAAGLFEEGFSYRSAATALGLPAYSVRRWEMSFKAIGSSLRMQSSWADLLLLLIR